MSELEISVVMATYNRAETLRETLDQLFKQDLLPGRYEIVVVDDGSPDQTRKVVEEARAHAPCALRYLWHENRGPGYTQNRGIEAAQAPLIVLMADDIFLARGALRAHRDAHAQLPARRERVVLGHVVQSPALRQSAFLRNWNPFRMDSLPVGALPPYLFWACNISFRREFMLEHGMFRAAMGPAGPAAHEDVEVGYRLHRAGMELIHVVEAFGYHHHIETLQGAMRRSRQRGENFPEFRARVQQPELVIRYHVLGFDTLRDHLRALFGERRRYLLGRDASPFWLPLRYLARALAFNRATVALFWLPLFEAAERSPALERWMHSALYRGVISHHFLRGARAAAAAGPASGSGS